MGDHRQPKRMGSLVGVKLVLLSKTSDFTEATILYNPNFWNIVPQ